MSHTAMWGRFGVPITAHPKLTLSAYLGHQASELAMQADSIPFPTIDDFRADSAFDPNPHELDLPEAFLETSLFVHSLAVWGPDVLIRAALACTRFQIERQTTCRSDLVAPRDAALLAVQRFIRSATDENRKTLTEACRRCNKIYAPHEDDPDSPEAETVRSHLGAAWWAAETALQDYKLEEYDGPEPREGSSTWCRRNAVWPINAAHAAAEWTPHDDVRAAIRTSLLDWVVIDHD